MTRKLAGELEMWGGIECTVNRVGNAYFDQMARNGHATHVDDLDLIGRLGIKAIRYPALWEHVAPDEHSVPDWSFPDGRLPRLRAMGIKPIGGLTPTAAALATQAWWIRTSGKNLHVTRAPSPSVSLGSWTTRP